MSDFKEEECYGLKIRTFSGWEFHHHPKTIQQSFDQILASNISVIQFNLDSIPSSNLNSCCLGKILRFRSQALNQGKTIHLQGLSQELFSYFSTLGLREICDEPQAKPEAEVSRSPYGSRIALHS